MIEVKDLVKQYGDKLAVDHISFSVQDGEILGFLGPNGAGKTTTMNIITGYLSSTAGTVTVDGCEILEDPMGAKKENRLPAGTAAAVPRYDRKGLSGFCV